MWCAGAIFFPFPEAAQISGAWNLSSDEVTALYL